MVFVPHEMHSVVLAYRYAESQRVVARKILNAQTQGIAGLAVDLDEKFTRIGICGFLGIHASAVGRLHRNSCRSVDPEFHRIGLVIPVDPVQRIQVESEVHRALSGLEQLRRALGAQLGVEGDVR